MGYINRRADYMSASLSEVDRGDLTIFVANQERGVSRASAQRHPRARRARGCRAQTTSSSTGIARSRYGPRPSRPFGWRSSPPGDRPASPEELLRLCAAPDAIDFGTGGSGALMESSLDVGRSLLPASEVGRRPHWLELGLDAAFEGLAAPAVEVLGRLSSRPPSAFAVEWREALIAWFEEQEPSFRERE